MLNVETDEENNNDADGNIDGVRRGSRLDTNNDQFGLDDAEFDDDVDEDDQDDDEDDFMDNGIKN